MKIIFINWRWKFRTPRVIVKGSNIVIASSFRKDKAIDFNNFIINKLTENPQASALVLIHAAYKNAFCFKEEQIDINKCFKYKVAEFFGNHSRKNSIVYSLFNQGKDSEPDINFNQFEFIWNYFWGKELRDLLEKFISTFLPLAIDQQGLSKMKEPPSTNYINEVDVDLGNAWETILKVLRLKQDIINSQETNLLEDFRLTPEEKASIAFPLEYNGNSEFTLDMLKKYIQDENGHNSIAKWLNEVVKLNKRFDPSK